MSVLVSESVEATLPTAMDHPKESYNRRGSDSIALRPLADDEEATRKQMAVIDDTFRVGKEHIFPWSQEESERVTSAMDELDSYLSQFDPSLSYEGTDRKIVWRKSCWFASLGLYSPLLETEEEIKLFDGDLKDGQTGIKALQGDRFRKSIEYLRGLLDDSLVFTARSVGLNDEMIARCSVRYRIIKYVSHNGDPGGIGLHPDGNLLSSLITNGPGLKVFDLDGTLREPGYNGTILMGGSTLYRWSRGAYPPTFHDVSIGREQKKVSIVAFFNFPDMTTIPRLGPVNHPGTEGKLEREKDGWFHDIRRIKEDDKSPEGELSELWSLILKQHKIVVPDRMVMRRAN
ncbi:hypothetical protein M758_2G186600 [Ceratodon purpureus]|nr:hypothetical protein M758_2G186600 [Ceratodon purpureus]